MSFLWINFNVLKLWKPINKKARPSPEHKNNIFNLFRNVENPFVEIINPYLKNKILSIEKILLPFFPCKKIKASMTVEAAVVLPLFIFFFVNLSCAVEMLRLHGTLQAALTNTGNKMSVYGCVLTEVTDKKSNNSILQEIGDLSFSYLYVKNAVIDYAGKEYLDSSPLLFGADGLQFVESEIFTSDDTFEITMTYAVAPWIDYVQIKPFRMANKYYGHIWNGYDLSGQSASGEKTKTVYITENASVYHENRNCTHLKLNIREVNILQISDERNSYGNKYTLCEKCGKGAAPAILYIGSEGDKYHYTKDCPGIIRTVYSMQKSEAAGKYRACSRCSK
jgi:hypothetical protein